MRTFELGAPVGFAALLNLEEGRYFSTSQSILQMAEFIISRVRSPILEGGEQLCDLDFNFIFKL